MVHGHKSQLPPSIYIPKLAHKSIAWGKTFSGAKVMFLSNIKGWVFFGLNILKKLF